MRTRLLVLAAGAAFAAAPAAAQSDARLGEARLDAAVRAAPSTEALGHRLRGARLGGAEARDAPPRDAWFGPDKVLHFGASFLLTLSGQYVATDKAGLSDTEALPFSVGVALGLGVAKEVADSQRTAEPYFSLRDLAADALGVAVGVLVTRL